MTYQELKNLKLEDVNESNIKSIKKVAHFKRNRVIEAGIVGSLFFLIGFFPFFIIGFKFLWLAILCSSITTVAGISGDFLFRATGGLCHIDIDEYKELKKSGKLAEIRQIVKQYKMSPMKKLSKLEDKREKLEDKLSKVNETIEVSKSLINRAVSKTEGKKFDKYVPTEYENDDSNTLGLN